VEATAGWRLCGVLDIFGPPRLITNVKRATRCCNAGRGHPGKRRKVCLRLNCFAAWIPATKLGPTFPKIAGSSSENLESGSGHQDGFRIAWQAAEKLPGVFLENNGQRRQGCATVVTGII